MKKQKRYIAFLVSAQLASSFVGISGWTEGHATDPFIDHGSHMPDITSPITCTDILGYIIVMPVDPALNILWQFCYAHCLARVALEACMLHIVPQDQGPIKQRLQTVERMASAGLTALTAAYKVFDNPDLRKELTDAHLDAAPRDMNEYDT